MKEKISYWNRKHKFPNWSEDIHYSEFYESEHSIDNFKKGIKLNNENTIRILLNYLSVYSFSREIKILDFACGKGDLLLELSKLFPNSSGIGIDISDYAISCFESKIKHNNLTKRFKGYSGSLNILEDIHSKKKDSFDIVICRDAFYLLSNEEQQSFFNIVADILNPMGVLYLADAAVNETVYDSVHDLVVKRQKGGNLISWSMNSHGRNFSIRKLLSNTNLELLHSPITNEETIHKSFASAANLVSDESVKSTYIKISDIAKPNKLINGKVNKLSYKSNKRNKQKLYSDYIYSRFIFRKQKYDSYETKQLGIDFVQDFSYSKRKVIIKKGKYSFELGKWNLIIGQSGSGKTTILKFLAGWFKEKNIHILNRPSKIFLLEQNPKLIEDISLKSNLILFNNDELFIHQVLENLGFPLNEINKKPSQISGGEYQRIALAQAILAQPDLLLLDEPCTGMDKIKKHHFFSSLKNFYSKNNLQSPTILAVDHEFNSVDSFFDNIYEIIHKQIYAIN